MRMRQLVTAAALVAVVAGSGAAMAAAHGKQVQGAIDFRTSVMNIYKWYLGPMGGMVKGERPWDQAMFAGNAQGLARAASLDLLPGFPKGSTDEDSDAKPEIWEKWSEFSEQYQDLQRESAKLAEVAAGGDMNAAKAQFKKTAETCGGCHKPFRKKK